MINTAIFFNHAESTELNKRLVKDLENYSKAHEKTIIYIVTAPLGENYTYDYENRAIVILSPGYKLMFVDLAGEDEFDAYCDDFITDTGSISSKYKYQDHIGRPRSWRNEYVSPIRWTEDMTLDHLFQSNKLPEQNKRMSELLISLITGSINDITAIGAENPRTLLEKVKKKIILFDAEQTRFIYQRYPIKKIVSVQGLSGTGKTELLLHKLRDVYLEDDSNKIFFTCHNIALSKKLRERIPHFFDFMQVNKQIQWEQRLWMAHAWGSHSDINSGFYAYICGHYNLVFYKYSVSTGYDFIFKKALDALNRIPSKQFQPCFDYIIVDESQDFPEVFFELCKKLVRKKVYIAGDVFQDIFETLSKKPRGVDIVLNRCYRTDPRTLMFAHGVGLGLFEDNKLNWFDKKGWERMGYQYSELRGQNKIRLNRLPINRFEDIEIDNSVVIENNTRPSQVCHIIRNLYQQVDGIVPGDIAVILIDEDKSIYNYIDQLCHQIDTELNIPVTRGHEVKKPSSKSIYVTNANNVKGLEFPYVICVTKKIRRSYKYRNTLYTMLTRSFIQSYLLVTDADEILMLNQGLAMINEHKYIEATIPSNEQQNQIRSDALKYQEEEQLSFQDLLEQVFEEKGIKGDQLKHNLSKVVESVSFDRFDKTQLSEFIDANRKFYE